jgi:hypothetical protein
MRTTGAAGIVALVLAVASACSSKGDHAAVSSDAGPSDAGPDAPLACPPTLDDWVAPAYHHAQTIEAVCSLLMVNDFYNSCLSASATSNACAQNWGAGEDMEHTLCQACLITPSSETTWGPLVDYGNGSGQGTVSVNVAGCVELLDPTHATCATSVQQADECQHAACDPSCPVTDSTSFSNWQACVDAAATGPCGTYLSSAACVNAEDAGPAAACVSGPDFETEFIDIATVFCSGPGG